MPYYIVIGFFCLICFVAIIVTVFQPKQKFADKEIIDESEMFIHNGQGHQFKHGENKIFHKKTLKEAKHMFMSALSDTNNIGHCKTSKKVDEKIQGDFEEMEIALPESYDWRDAYPQCVQQVMNVGEKTNCSASYVMSTLSAVEDRICMANNKTIKLSTQEILDCDDNQYGCEGGMVNKVLQWGRKKGFITEECMEYEGVKKECEVDHFESNYCRIENQIYKVSDYCISFQAESIKREIFTNGPVIGQMQPYTDFLAYKEGVYHKTPEAFKFNGMHIVKIVGWVHNMDGADEWIVENSWGDSWGENGYARIAGGRGDTQIEFYALGASVVPYTVFDYYSMQNMRSNYGDDDYLTGKSSNKRGPKHIEEQWDDYDENTKDQSDSNEASE